MNKNILKVLCISFIILFSAFFINVDGVKAAPQINQTVPLTGSNSSAEGGYASCYYQKHTQDFHTQAAAEKFYGVVITVTNNGGTAQLGYKRFTSGGILSNDTAGKLMKAIKDNEKDIKNKDTMFTPGYEKLFHDDNGNWSCPSKVYVKQGLIYWYVNLNEDSNYTEALNLVYNESVQSGSSEEAKNLDEYTNQAGADYKDNGALDGSKTGADNDIEKIKAWGEANQGKEGQYGIEDAGSPCGAISPAIADLITLILWIIDIAAIIILIIMTMVNLVQAITGSDEEKFRDVFKHLRVRIIVVVVLLLLPVIVGAAITMINNSAGGTVEIGADGEPFCTIEK